MPKRGAPGPSSAPVKKIVKKTVNNNGPTYNITNHFAPVAGPTSSAVADPDAWLPRDADADRPTRRLKDGRLVAKCKHTPSCPKNRGAGQGIANFAPVKDPAEAADFATALQVYESARKDRNAEALEQTRRVLEELR